MFRRVLWFTTITSLLFFMSSFLAFAKEPKNLAIVKRELIHYHDSGEYLKDQAKVIDQAMLYLKERLANPLQNNKKLAIVLDIDETSLSNYKDMLEMNFGGSLKEINEAEELANDDVIQPTLELFRYAKANNVAVFFITGRTPNQKESTERNLKNVGFTGWDSIIYKPANYNEKSVIPYKSSARKSLEDQGYDIILSIGDQKSDLLGQHADKTFKLPNPYYLIP